MIFPYNVDRELRNSSKLDANSKTQVIVSFTIIGLIVSYFVTKYLVVTLAGASIGLARLAHFILCLAVSFLIFRFVIFNEEEKLEEYNNKDNDSLYKFLDLRKESHTNISFNRVEIPVMEMKDGSFLCTISLKFGENTKETAVQTKDALSEILDSIVGNGLSYKVVVSREKFEDSIESQNYMTMINSIENKVYSAHLIRIYSEMLEYTKINSNVNVINILINASNASSKVEFPRIINSLKISVKEYNSGIREFKVLNSEEYFELLKDFNGVEALDFSMIKAIDSIIEEDEDEPNEYLVGLHRIKFSDGSTKELSSSVDKSIRLKEKVILND